MSSIGDYTDTDSVRSCLGITDNEVDDDMMGSMLLEDRLLSELSEWLPSHSSLYATWTATGASDQLQTNARNLRLYATYYCAAQVTSFQLALPHTISDGKNQLRRFEGINLAALGQHMAAEASVYRQRLENAVNSTVTTVPTLAGVAIPGYDPVTNG